MTRDDSLATVQRSLAGPSVEYPLEPALTAGCPETSDEAIQYPVGVDYAYDELDASTFDRPLEPGLERWAPLLPPLVPETALGEGNTPLVETPELADWLELEDAVYVKDESRNPTWSHKDRLNRCAVSAAVREESAGVVVSSTGNHGAAAAAYAARANLPCVVLTGPRTPAAVRKFQATYGAVVLAVDDLSVRRAAVDRLTDEHDFHPVSSRTPVHTGHAYGPEGYKTVAYELFCQLDHEVPGAVVVPTCYAELLYGVWKGFRELAAVGVADRKPRMVACEPGVRAPLVEALERGRDVASVEPAPTAAYSIKATTSSVRGVRAVRESDGIAIPFTEAHLEESQHRLSRAGLWQESSGAAGVAGLQTLTADATAAPGVTADGEAAGSDALDVDGPIVCLATSSGFKDGGGYEAPSIDPEWEAIRDALAAHDDVPI